MNNMSDSIDQSLTDETKNEITHSFNTNSFNVKNTNSFNDIKTINSHNNININLIFQISEAIDMSAIKVILGEILANFKMDNIPKLNIVFNANDSST